MGKTKVDDDRLNTNTMLPQRRLSPAETVAVEAIHRFEPKIVKVNTYDEIYNYGGGVLVLAEYYYDADPGETELDGPYEYQVLVRDGRASVFSDWSLTFREGSKRAELVSKLASPDVVTAVLTFVLVASYIVFVGSGKGGEDAAKVLGAALTTVLGFWFGRQSKNL